MATKRIELCRDEFGFEVADVDGDTVMFRTYEIANLQDYPDLPEGDEFERCAFSMPLDDLRKIIKAIDGN